VREARRSNAPGLRRFQAGAVSEIHSDTAFAAIESYRAIRRMRKLDVPTAALVRGSWS